MKKPWEPNPPGPDRELEGLTTTESATGRLWRIDIPGGTGDWSLTEPELPGEAWSVVTVWDDRMLGDIWQEDPAVDSDIAAVRLGAAMTDQLAAEGYTRPTWRKAANPEYWPWVEAQPMPTEPLVVACVRGEVSELFIGADQRGGLRFVFLVGPTPALDILGLQESDLSLLRTVGLEPLDVDGLSAACDIPRRAAALALHDMQGAPIYLYDPVRWQGGSRPRRAAKAPTAPPRVTTASRIESALGEEGAMTVAEIAEATGATPEAVLLALKRGGFEPNDERPTKWRRRP